MGRRVISQQKRIVAIAKTPLTETLELPKNGILKSANLSIFPITPVGRLAVRLYVGGSKVADSILARGILSTARPVPSVSFQGSLPLITDVKNVLKVSAINNGTTDISMFMEAMTEIEY